MRRAGNHLSLGVWSGPHEAAIAPQLRHLGVELVSEHHGEWHAFLSLVGRIAEHQALVASACRHSTYTPVQQL